MCSQCLYFTGELTRQTLLWSAHSAEPRACVSPILLLCNTYFLFLLWRGQTPGAGPLFEHTLVLLFEHTLVLSSPLDLYL